MGTHRAVWQRCGLQLLRASEDLHLAMNARQLVEQVEADLGRPIPDREDAIRRLRAIADPATRGYMADLLLQAEKNEDDPGFLARREADERRAKEERHEWLKAAMARALDGRATETDRQANDLARQLAEGYAFDAGGNRLDLDTATMEQWLADFQAQRYPVRR